MKELQAMEEIQSFISNEKLALIYISRQGCSVCHALLPKVEELLQAYPTIKSGRIDADKIPETAGYFSVFTVPVIILFVEGKEMIRKARFVAMDELTSEIDKIYSFYRDEASL